jgi:hypothetical protein
VVHSLPRRVNVPIRILELFGLHSRHSSKKNNGRADAGVVSLFFNVPFGTALGVHALWVLAQ